MEILALIGGVIAAIVFVAERLAFAVMLWLMVAWVWRATALLRVSITKATHALHREVLIVVGQLRWLREAVQYYWMARTLRRQFGLGATP